MNGQPAAVALPATAMTADRRERLAALFDAHEERLYRLARRLTASADDANDLVQETFLRAVRSMRSVPDGRAEAWLVRVLINIRRDEWRKRAVRRQSAPALLADAAPHVSSAETALMARRAVWAALDALHPRRRAIVVMHELEGLDVDSIAALLGVSAMTIRWNLSVARRELKRILRPHMGEPR